MLDPPLASPQPFLSTIAVHFKCLLAEDGVALTPTRLYRKAGIFSARSVFRPKKSRLIRA
jgi:hypothetical protein